ncbi:Alpha/Beta hydrolase protein [Biscogniauxia marginata]|nr:Alpha/Beta hydrolase protein [Biscogniauxia marginata]
MELGVSVLPPITAHTHTIVFLHGRDDTARNLADTLFWSRDSYRRSLKDIFPSVRWVFPQSEMRPCESDGGIERSQWFDIWNPLDFSDREELQAPGLRESVMSIRRIVAREARSVGGLSRVVLGGISQGGAAAVHVFINLPLDDTQLPPSPAISPATAADAPASPPDVGADDSVMGDDDDDDNIVVVEGGTATTSTATTPPPRLAAFVGFACGLPFPGGTLEETREVLGLPGAAPSDEVVRRTPAFLAHCADDPVVFVEYGKQLRGALRDFGVADVAWREYEDGGHWVNSPRGVDDLVEFLRAQGLPAALPPRPYAGSISMSPD